MLTIQFTSINIFYLNVLFINILKFSIKNIDNVNQIKNMQKEWLQKKAYNMHGRVKISIKEAPKYCGKKGKCFSGILI